jgi:hypothetical protein
MAHPDDRTRQPFVIEEAAALLGRTPAVLDALLRGLPDTWTRAHEGGETWSPFDVVGHLVHGEQTDWLPRARIILNDGDSRTFDPYDRFAQFSKSAGRTLPELLDQFAQLRAANLRDLLAMALTNDDLDRAGRHPAFGPVTLRQLLATWVAHDLDHIIQVSRILARQYAGEVGPWQAYLRVISGVQG